MPFLRFDPSIVDCKKFERGNVTIYGLLDPNDMTLRYIGKTVCPKFRMSHHLQDPSFALRGWILALKDMRQKPIFKTLAMVSDRDWERAEKYFIKAFRCRAYILYNIHEGGRYTPGVLRAKLPSRKERFRRRENGDTRTRGDYMRAEEAIQRAVVKKRATVVERADELMRLAQVTDGERERFVSYVRGTIETEDPPANTGSCTPEEAAALVKRLRLSW